MPKVSTAHPVETQHTTAQAADDTQSASKSEEAPPVYSKQPKTPQKVSVPPFVADPTTH